MIIRFITQSSYLTLFAYYKILKAYLSIKRLLIVIFAPDRLVTFVHYSFTTRPRRKVNITTIANYVQILL